MTTQQRWWGVFGVRVGLLVALLIGIISSIPVGAASGTLTVSLVPRPSDGVETVTLSYEGAGSLSLAGWTIEDTLANTVIRHTFGDVTLQAGESYRFCTGNGTREDCDHHTFFSSVWNDAGDTFVLRNADGEEMIRITYTNAASNQVFTGSLVLETDGDTPPVQGCIDELATNFNPAATVSDGSCIYIPNDESGGGGDDDTNEEGAGDDNTEAPPLVANLVPLPAALVPRVPGHCPLGFTKWVDDEVEGKTWYADDVYEVVVVVGGPPKIPQNRDGSRYMVTTGPTQVGMVVSRQWHEIGFVCVR
jgi:hypothetical protein